ncbi:MAG: xanthine dehydrogenase family protein molybdopterin-binding subunit [Nitrososphaerales archaeon]
MSQQVLKSKHEETSKPLQAVGRPIKRKEDPRLVTGSAKYVDDFRMTNMLFSSVLRSPYGHARIKSIDTSAALALSGVKLAFTGETLPKSAKNQLSKGETPDSIEIVRPILASKEVTYVGEPVAFVVADTLYTAEDALELISVEYESLEPIIDPLEALKPESPKARLGLKSNVVANEKREFGDVNLAFQKAFKIVKMDLLNQRVAPSPLEPRACIASYDAGTGLTLWISTQGPFQVRSDLADVLDLPENKLRVIAPEVGGGFGAKLSLYSEEVLASLASIQLCCPVKWIETRSENLQSMTQGRGQNQLVEIAASEKGRILGLKVNIVGDAGAYLTEGSTDSTFTLRMVPGCYIIPAYYGETTVVLTNKVPHDAYRGASRPEATYIIERAMDELARELGLDPVEVRLRNFIPKEDFPYKTVGDLDYDSGDYSMNLKKALEYSGYDRWRSEQKIKSERLIGIGISTYVEICAFGPSFPQTAAMTVSKSGKVTVISGTSPHGQGHETPLAQIASDILGIDVDEIQVIYGDTIGLPWGTFTAGSRSAALGGTAVKMCADKIKQKMAEIASERLQVSPPEIEFKEGNLISKNDNSKVSFRKIADDAYNPEKIPKGMEPVLFAFSAFAPENYTFPFGTHVAVVEIDTETGRVKILEYTSVDDVGKVLNPLIVQGQVHGGVAQGLGQAMLEQVKYNEEGQLLTSSFLDYQIPLAEDIPDLRTFRTETPTKSNPLGIKGVGEAGTIAATPTIANAVADALAQRGIKVEKMPFSLDYVKSLLRKRS